MVIMNDETNDPTAIIENARHENAQLVKRMERDYYESEISMHDFLEKWGDDKLSRAIIAMR